MHLQPKLRDFQVGWICAVHVEYVAACALLDEEYRHLMPAFPNDNNAYTLGRVGGHSVVVACLPKGKYGLASAASVAKDMLRSFPSIKFGLMVGIGGAAPSTKHDIRLGDVVVSTPTAATGGAIEYNYGKAIQGRGFERTGSLNAPPTKLLTALTKLSGLHERNGDTILTTVQEMIRLNPSLKDTYDRPPASSDTLFNSSFLHIDDTKPCTTLCARYTEQILSRPERNSNRGQTVVHYGLIASADQLMKNACLRDQFAEEDDVLCFEMEAAGLMDTLPCLVVRGICDYSDTHKNDIWQGHAAAVAAAYAKELLAVVPATGIAEIEKDHASNVPIDVCCGSDMLRGGSYVFNNYGEVKNQAGVQNISGGLTFH